MYLAIINSIVSLRNSLRKFTVVKEGVFEGK